MIVDLSLTNSQLYTGCEITSVNGRDNLVTPPVEAGEIIGKNISEMVDECPSSEREEVTLTGPMAVWSYLIVFHAILHSFRRVYYDDGKGLRMLIASHG